MNFRKTEGFLWKEAFCEDCNVWCTHFRMLDSAGERVDLGACGFGFCDSLGAVCHGKSGPSALNQCQIAADMSLLTESGN